MKCAMMGMMLCATAGVSLAAAAAPQSTLAWKQGDGTLALTCGEKTVWQFNYKDREGKPYFHPVTIAGSPSLTDLRPKDHPWHLALWFSWKFINAVNYWENSSKTGLPAGVTEVVDANVAPRADHSARMDLKMSYHPPGQPPVLTENRTLEVSPPTADGAWHIDWLSTFQAGNAEVRLDRTPILGQPNGKSFGGYAGLSLRLVPALHDWQFVGSAGPVVGSHTRSHWMSFGGPLQEGKSAAIIVLEHPKSFRAPTPWYVIQKMPYFSPAVIYDEPYTLPAHQSFTLKYRILFQPGIVDHQVVERQWQQFGEGNVE